MKNIVSFQNKGFLDIRMITTFGVSAKASDNPIGYFGTGLKYAIAVILREGGKLTLRNGTDYYEFFKKKTTIRSKEFELIVMKNFGTEEETELPFTTELGKNWELWQAYRELYCNTMDEDGIVSCSELLHQDDCVTGYVESKEFLAVHEDKNTFILDKDLKPIYTSTKADVYAGEEGLVFYKGIRVENIGESPIFFNFHKNLELTEDRTLKQVYPVEQFYRDFIVQITEDKDLIMSCITNPENLLNNIYLDDSLVKPSEVFIECLRTARQLGIDISSRLRKFDKTCFYDTVTPIVGNKKYEDLVSKAIEFLKKADLIRQDSSYETIIVEKLASIRHLAAVYDGKIYLSRKLMDSGLKQVVSAYLEEYYHLGFNLQDETYQFQNFLFDKIITLAENVTGDII